MESAANFFRCFPNCCGVTSAIFKYQFEDKRSPEFYIVGIPNPDYDPDDAKKKNDFRSRLAVS
ncbi:MAG: hypothetical protein ACXQTS_05900 [Candidatus Methanospirareceae archaeon]